MSELSLPWLSENFLKNNVIFDVGCADMGDTVTWKSLLPDNTYYAFECSQAWKEHNEHTAAQLGINYFHVAMSDHCDGVQFYPSDKCDGKEWHWSGTTFEPGHLDNLQWGSPYTVASTTLNEFCKTHDITPDLVHIDVEGGEFAVLNNMDPTVRPKAIWAEICILSLHNTNTNYDKFNAMMLSQGYTQIYISTQDALYVRHDVSLTKYPIESAALYQS
jgi:FkbM family methyltransferase